MAAAPFLFVSARPIWRALLTLAVFVSGARSGRIDTHFHALPAAYQDALKAAGGDPSGFSTPSWSIDDAKKSMLANGVELGVLSVSSPGVPIAGTAEVARQLARTLNDDFGTISNDSSQGGRFAFFGVLPDFQDVNGTLAEIDYLYSQQKQCAGVTVYTSYGGKLLGDPTFAPIWSKLQQYKALVFLHPSVMDVTPFFIGPSIPQPIVDYPLATTRAAVDLVMTGTLRACPDIDIILAHAGGALPFIVSRATTSLAIPEVAQDAKVSLLQATADFKRYYFDIALSTSSAQLDGLLDVTAPDHILFGSDFPYAPQYGVSAIILAYSNYVATNIRGSQIAPPVLRNNAIKLLNQHSQGRKYV